MAEAEANGAAPQATWEQTALWKLIEGRADAPMGKEVAAVLRPLLERAEDVLSNGGGGGTDFTLHDEDHAYRVAQRMIEIIPTDVQERLNSMEVGLLLLSAYLHDIGMTPKVGVVQNHYDYLLTGNHTREDSLLLLTDQERADFQEWLDDCADGLEPPICKGTPTPEQTARARLLIAHYCRSRHNDWSARWIAADADANNLRMQLYHGWIDDLVHLCLSHHQDEADLAKPEFDPRLVTGLPTPVHRRYLACVLRMADILEFDPKRTPDVLFHHRDVTKGSRIYWEKDHQVGISIKEDGILIEAYPETGRHHHAIETMVADIKRELELVRSLDAKHPFRNMTGQTEPLFHRWDLATCIDKITPQVADGQPKYYPIKAEFRPDTKKLLRLLSGVELYRDPVAAVRELLQNAFDGVREQIAYQRLRKPDGGNESWGEYYARGHEVTLNFEVREDGAYLICEDDGVGMNKEIIEQYLLVSGSAVRHELLSLDRRCREHGFTLERTGQFGVGVLSYFMLADQMTIRTRRSGLAPRPEANGWRFITDGIGSFGELTADRDMSEGTTVLLQLKSDLFEEGPAAWYGVLRDYLKETLVYVPCQFTLKTNLEDGEPLKLAPGWTTTVEDLTEEILGWPDALLGSDDEEELMPTARLKELEASKQDEQRLREEFLACISWHELTGFLGYLGRYRVLIPAFQLPGGMSLTFLRLSDQAGQMRLRRLKYWWSLSQRDYVTLGWKGMATESESSPAQRSGYPVRVFIDWCHKDAGNLSVSRDEFTVSAGAEQALKALWRQIGEHLRRFCEEHASSPYAWLNASLAKLEPPAGAPPCWVRFAEDRGQATWAPFAYPVIVGATPPGALSLHGQRVTIAPAVPGFTPNIEWDVRGLAPSRIVRGWQPDCQLLPLWTEAPQRPEPPTDLIRCPFPPEWRAICGAAVEDERLGRVSRTFWSSDHPLLRAVEEQGWEWADDMLERSLNPLPVQEELLKARSRSAAWVIRCIRDGKRDLWNALAEQEAALLRQIWERAFGRGAGASTEIGFVRDEAIRVLSPQGWQEYDLSSPEAARYLPEPGPDWRLELVKE